MKNKVGVKPFIVVYIPKKKAETWKPKKEIIDSLAAVVYAHTENEAIEKFNSKMPDFAIMGHAPVNEVIP